ncbi:alpha/beta hydrolase [Amycolatopsis anabasis]|uniref:alpha/beta hydrolase n=1 Tax=Amycolatopsis anabasis TaxID=1840409 RepID=UPI00131EA37A|nr:alpha/beta hydrolase [Amycolatopsis anabasis]
MRTRIFALLAAVAALVSCAPAAAAAPGVPWHPCEDNAKVECAVVPVPIDWAKPDGPKIDLAVARRPAADPAHRAGSLVYAPAGPGSSGVDAVANDQIFGLLFPPEQAARFDVVSFDPRGVRRSHPVLCDEKALGELNHPAPRNAAEFDRLLAAQAALGRSCRDRTGPLIDHLDSNVQARDLDALRAALGEQTLNIYALSYGTVLGQMYAELFPGRIRTLVLDANVDHSASTERTDVTGSRAAQESFDVFVRWCAASAACSLRGKDVKAIVADLYAKADAGELTDPDDPAVRLDRGSLAQKILEPLGNADVAGVARRIAALAGPRPAARAGAGGPAPNALPIYLFCADHRNDIDSYRDLQRVRARSAAVAPDVKTGWHGVPQLCANPPFRTTNPPHRLHVRGAPPILVTNSRYDDSTPHAGAVRVAEQIGNAALVTYDGLGHGAAPRGRCMRDVVSAYLIDRRVPAAGTRCPAVPLP